MKKITFIIIIIGLNLLSAQTIQVKGQILNAKTNKAVPYANLKLEDSNVGTSTKRNGNFKISIDKSSLNSEVLITCLGYKSVIVKASDLKNKTFYLKPKVEFLDEVVINHEIKTFVKGSTKGIKQGYIPQNYGNICKGQDGVILAQYFKGDNQYDTNKYLKKVSIPFRYYTKSFSQIATVRVRIFDKDAINGNPKTDLLKDNVILTIDPSRQQEYDLDFSKYKIEMPKEGFFVAFEVLSIPSNQVNWSNGNNSYFPIFDMVRRKNRHNKDYGNKYVYYNCINEWRMAHKNFVLPIEVTLAE